MHSTIRTLSLGLVAAAFIAGPVLAQSPTPSSNASGAHNQPQAELGQAAPNFTLRDQAGEVVKLSDLKGKTVVLEWINPDCPYVKRHYKAGTMKSLAEKYEGKDVVWLAINSTHYFTPERNQEWVDENELSYRILNDAGGQVGHLYAARTTPHMFVVDPAGVLVYDGAIDDDPRGNKNAPANYVDAVLTDLAGGGTVEPAGNRPYGCSVKYAK